MSVGISPRLWLLQEALNAKNLSGHSCLVLPLKKKKDVENKEKQIELQPIWNI